MRKLVYLSGLFFCFSPCSAQTAPELITMVKASQSKLQTVYYKMERSDTLVSGETRVLTGSAKLKVLPADSIFGFAFWGRRDGINSECIYDGNTAFNIDHNGKKYESISSAKNIPNYLGRPGGQMILTDLVRIDTTNTLNFTVSEDERYYYLVMQLPDLKEYDVFKRVKTITVDKHLLLPVAVRRRQETLGKVQDLYYKLRDIRVNDPSVAYDFSSQRIPDGYTLERRGPSRELTALIGKPMPAFRLASFDNNNISSESFRNKVVLLDFWEVWCGPCLESMPKVQNLYDKYREKGLQVYGMMSEKNQLEPARIMVSKRKVSIPMLQSDEGLNKTFGISAVPTYILVDKEGIVRFTSEGFSEKLEEEIRKLL